jgi:hypothetical protein
MKTLLSSVAAITFLALASGPADALTFDFSFINTEGNVTGTVTGEIDGLANNLSGQQATAVSIDLYPAGLGALGTVPISVPLPVPAFNQFTVNSSGFLTSELFLDVTPTYTLVLNSVAQVFYLSSSRGCPALCVENSQLTITTPSTSATPLPAALPLFATGLGALGLLGWRRKRKVSALAA